MVLKEITGLLLLEMINCCELQTFADLAPNINPF